MDEFKLEGAEQSVTDRFTRRRSKRKIPWWIGLVGLASVLVGVVGWLTVRKVPAELDGQDPPVLTASVESPEKSSQEPAAASVPDDGQTLWVSPTAGSALPLNYIPPGTQLLLHFRPVALVQHSEGEKVLAALGPWGGRAQAMVEQATGATWSEMEELLLAVVPQIDGRLEFAWRVRLAEPWSAEELARRFPAGVDKLHQGQTFRITDDDACFLPNATTGNVLVVCDADSVRSLIESEGSAPPLPRDFQRLLSHVDAQRTVSIVALNKFFQTSGFQMLTGRGEPLRDALQKLLGDDVTAVALSTHWDKDFFWELRCMPTLNHRPHAYAEKLRSQLQRLAAEAEPSVIALAPNPHGKNVVARFPAMLQVASNYARPGTQDRHALLRGYLPIAAGHNLLMAAELLLSQPGQSDATSATSSQPQPRSVADRLNQFTSLSFVKETLARSVELLSEDLGVDIQIAGRDLQLEGITKNQSLALDLRNRPAREILLEIVLRANPDRTASGPDDPKQKLVFVIRPGKNGQPGAIVVTTRAAAERRGENLPAEFVEP